MRWEYKLIAVVAGINDDGSAVARLSSRSFNPDDTLSSFEYLDHSWGPTDLMTELGLLGAEGWELVSVTPPQRHVTWDGVLGPDEWGLNWRKDAPTRPNVPADNEHREVTVCILKRPLD